VKNLNVINGQGITASILAQLQKDGIVKEGQNLSGSVWTQIMNLVANDSQGAKQYSGGSNFVTGNSEVARASWKNNFVIAKNQVISFTEELWANIVKLAKGEKPNREIKEENAPLTPTKTTPAVTTTPILVIEDEEASPKPDVKPVEIPQTNPANENKDNQTTSTNPVEMAKNMLSKTYGNVKYRTRPVNGKEQSYAFYKNNETGKTERVIILEDGSLEKLVTIDEKGKNEFITESALLKAIGINYLPDGVKCKCDEKGNLTFYNKKTGESISASEVKDFGKDVKKESLSPKEEVVASNTPPNSPVEKEITMTDAEVEAYLDSGKDKSCQAFIKYLSDTNNFMQGVESQYNFDREDLLGIFNITDEATKSQYSNASLTYEMGQTRLLDIKNTLKYWKDTPEGTDVSKNFMRYNNLTLTEVRHETLPNGVKVYHAKEGYYSLCFEKLSDEDLKSYGLEISSQ